MPLETGVSVNAVTKFMPPTKDKPNKTAALFQENDPLSAIYTDSARVMHAQRGDPAFKPLIDYLLHKTLPGIESERQRITKSAKHYILNNGILYYNFPSSFMRHHHESRPRLVVPNIFRLEVLFYGHDALQAGHFGFKRSLARIGLKYWWPTMLTDVKNHVRSCIHCQQRKGHPVGYGLSRSIIAREPWDVVCADFIGPLPATANGNRYILVVVDVYTKWCEAYATVDCSADTVAEKLFDNVITRYGSPRTFITDQGSNFIGEVISNLHQKLGTVRWNTSAYHPQTNGQCERMNKELYNLISTFVDEHTDWDDCLPACLFAYRTSVHESTGETPFFMMHLRDPNWGTDLYDHVTHDPVRWPNADEYKRTLMSIAEDVHKNVRRRNDLVRQKRDRNSNKQLLPNLFKEGSLVWLYVPRTDGEISKKFVKPWQGPLRILYFTSPTTVRLRTLGGKVLQQSVNIARLKRYFGPDLLVEKIDIHDDFDWERETVVRAKRVADQLLRDTSKAKFKELEYTSLRAAVDRDRTMSSDTDSDDITSAVVPTNDSVRQGDLLYSGNGVDSSDQDLVDFNKYDSSVRLDHDDNDIPLGEYEIEKIVSAQTLASGRCFKVRWKGYDSSYDSWLWETEMDHAKDLVDRFFRNNGKVCTRCGKYTSTSRDGLCTHKKKCKG